MFVLADNPVAYWRLGDTTADAVDLTGKTMAGKYDGGPQQGVQGAIQGDRDTAVKLDGQDDEIRVGVATDFDFSGTTQFSVEAWIQPDLLDDGARHVFTKQHRGSPKDGFAVLVSGPKGVVFERFAADANEQAVFLIQAGALVHVVATYDGNTMVLYVDGERRDSIADAHAMASVIDVAVIGSAGDGSHFAGVIDEVAVYNKPLLPERVLAHYQARLASDAR